MGSKAGKAAAAKKEAPSPNKTPLKPKVEQPWDLTYFIYLGGLIINEEVPLSPKLSNLAIATTQNKFKAPEPSKPIAEMTEEERVEYNSKVDKAKQKFEMQQLMEKNLQQKNKQGTKPPTPPVQGGFLGKAKKKMQQTSEKLQTKAEEVIKKEETVEERVKRQAMAGAGGTLTGGATANLGHDIAKSQAIKDLEKKRREYEKSEEEKRKKEAEEKVKQEEEKKRQKPKGLADFLNQAEKQQQQQQQTLSKEDRRKTTPKEKLNRFLQSVESAGPVQYPSSSNHKEEEVEEKPKENKLAAFLSSKTHSAYQIAEDNADEDVLSPTAVDHIPEMDKLIHEEEKIEDELMTRVLEEEVSLTKQEIIEKTADDVVLNPVELENAPQIEKIIHEQEKMFEEEEHLNKVVEEVITATIRESVEANADDDVLTPKQIDNLPGLEQIIYEQEKMFEGEEHLQGVKEGIESS